MTRLIINKGITRIVISFFGLSFKFPNPINGHVFFLQGCLSNYKERQFYKEFKNYHPISDLICPSYFCSYFGLLQIQKQCSVNTRELTEEELKHFEVVRNGESKPANFGFIDNKLVCLDYA